MSPLGGASIHVCRRLTVVAIVISGLAALTCRSLAPTPPVPGEAEQLLYRVEYEAADERGGARLVLRRWSLERYSLQVSDRLAGALWTFEVDGAKSILLDHVAQRYCEGLQELTLPEIGIVDLPSGALPRVLTGLPPFPLPSGGERPSEVRDPRGRRIRLRWGDEGLSRWSLWEDGRPVMWWQGDARHGILSHAAGYQLRWRLRVREPMRQSAPPLRAPTGYVAGGCAPGAA